MPGICQFNLDEIVRKRRVIDGHSLCSEGRTNEWDTDSRAFVGDCF
jgi:hypothetical protein